MYSQIKTEVRMFIDDTKLTVDRVDSAIDADKLIEILNSKEDLRPELVQMISLLDIPLDFIDIFRNLIEIMDEEKDKDECRALIHKIRTHTTKMDMIKRYLNRKIKP